MFSFLNPYMLWVKIAAAIVALLAAYNFGHNVGSNSATIKCDAQITEWQAKETAWDKARAELQTKVAEAIAEGNAKVIAIMKDNAAQVLTIQTTYQKTLKELNDAKQKLKDQIANAANTDPANASSHSTVDVGSPDGLWVFVDYKTCKPGSTNAGGNVTVPGTSSSDSGGDSTFCRLSPKTANPLVDLLSEADQVVIQLNLCVNESKINQKPSAKTESPQLEF